MPFLAFNFTTKDSLECADGYSYLLGNFIIQYIIRHDKQMIKEGGHPSTELGSSLRHAINSEENSLHFLEFSLPSAKIGKLCLS